VSSRVLDRVTAKLGRKLYRALVNDPRINLGARYGVRVFTLNKWNDFIDWLTALRDDMSEEHRLALAEAYPRS
jgi:hypothetical protein